MAAKIVQVSSDNGATWHTLPGSTGSVSEESAAATDTIFGQSYQSSEVTLINWSVSANSVYKGFAGYKAKIKKPGTPTAMTTEAMTLVSGKTYRINDLTKRVWDRTATFTVFDNAVDHTADVDSFDYLFGTVTFDAAYTVTGPVTVSGTFLPMTDIAAAQSYTLTQTADAIDQTAFDVAQGNGGKRVFIPGLRTVAVNLSGFWSSSSTWRTDLSNRTEYVIEVNPDGLGNSIARGFFKLQTHGQSGDVGALEEETLTFNHQVPLGPEFPFNWLHTGATTLSQAVQIVLTSWLNQTVIDVRYLADGVNGFSGDCVVTNVSLEGSLDGMNTFNVDLQGSGAQTAVP